jgi:hypothetical protein
MVSQSPQNLRGAAAMDNLSLAAGEAKAVSNPIRRVLFWARPLSEQGWRFQGMLGREGMIDGRKWRRSEDASRRYQGSLSCCRSC